MSNPDIIIPGNFGADGLSPTKAAAGVNCKEDDTGQDGSDTSDGSPSWLGRGKCVQATDGTKGAKGDRGENAFDGSFGRKPPLLIIKVGSMPTTSEPIKIESIGGKGGEGGNGGEGGDGADGGNAGVNNSKCLNKKYTRLAKGGLGGDGGIGGDGGLGGDGGNGGDVYTYSDQPSIDLLLVGTSTVGAPGNGGNGAEGGQGGLGGYNEVKDGDPIKRALPGQSLGGGRGKRGGNNGFPGVVAYRRLTDPPN